MVFFDAWIHVLKSFLYAKCELTPMEDTIELTGKI